MIPIDLDELQQRVDYYRSMSDYFDGPLECSVVAALIAAAREARRLRALLIELAESRNASPVFGYAIVSSRVLAEARRLAEELAPGEKRHKPYVSSATLIGDLDN